MTRDLLALSTLPVSIKTKTSLSYRPAPRKGLQGSRASLMFGLCNSADPLVMVWVG